MNFWFFLYWFEVYSLYSSRTLDKFCEVLFNRVISQTHRLIFVTLGTRLWWSLELQPCYFSNSPAHICHFRHQNITKSWTSTGLFLNRTKSFVTNRWFSRVLAHTYRRQWTKFARSLLPTTNMCGRPIRNRDPMWTGLEGHFMHENEHPWQLHSKIFSLSKISRPSKLTSH